MAQHVEQKPPVSRRRGNERKLEILTVARAVFSERGYENTSVSEIAARVGVVEGAIYKHFATKRDLLFEAMCAFYRPVIEQTREQLSGIQGARNRLRFLIWRQLRGFAEEPGVCRLIIQDIRPRRDYQESIVHELNRESTSLTSSVLDEGVRSGEFKRDLPITMVRDLIFGGIEHIAWKSLSGRQELDIDATADDLTRVVLGGIAESLPQPECHALAPESPAVLTGDGSGGRASPESSLSAERRRLNSQLDRLETLLDRIAAGDAAGGGGS